MTSRLLPGALLAMASACAPNPPPARSAAPRADATASSSRLAIAPPPPTSPRPFDPIPPALADAYHVRLERYFASPDIEAKERTALAADVDSFRRAPAPKTAPALDAYLVRAEGLLASLRRHAAYLHLRSSIDTTDRASAAALTACGNDEDTVDAAVHATLAALPIANMSAARPALKRWSFLFDEVRAQAAHAVPPEQAKLEGELASPLLESLTDLYFTTVSSTAFGTVKTAHGELDVKRDARAIAADPDPAVRKEGYARLLAGYAERRDVYASLLLDIVREKDQLAKLARYEDAPSEAYESRMELTRAEVTDCLARVEKRADVNEAYEAVVRDHLAKVAGGEVHVWDLRAPDPSFAVPRFDLADAQRVMADAMSRLGPDYATHFADLVNPAHGRLDVRPEAKGRYTGAFSAAGDPSSLFVGRFAGYLQDVGTFVHEAGHAVHRQLVAEAGVSPFFASGAKWISEGIAIFNQLILEDTLARAATGPGLEAYYLAAFIDDISFQIFGSAQEGALEQAIYDGARSGAVKSADDLDALTLQTFGEYSSWPARDPVMKSIWTRKSLMFEDPVYLVNYLYAGLLATKLFTLLEKDPTGFGAKYVALLREGFDARGVAMVKKVFGVDFRCDVALDEGLALMKDRTEGLKRAYAGLEARRP